MKKFVPYLFSVLFITLNGVSSAQPFWKKVSPKGWTGEYLVLNAHPTKKVIALSMQDNHLVSQDGFTWQPVSISQNKSSIPIFAEYSSPSVVWAGFQNEPIRKSTDGGITWVNTGIGSDFLEIKFLDSLTGFGRKKTGSFTKLVKTTNGGLDWSESGNNLPSSYSKFSITSDGIIRAIAGKYIVKTSNYGLNWDSTFSGSLTALSGLKFLNSQFGYANNSNHIFFTEDGGANWIESGITTLYSIKKVQFMHSDTGWISSNSQNKFLRTFNRGASWDEVSPALDFSMANFIFTSGTEGWALKNYGSGVMHTTDGGVSWTRSPIKGVSTNDLNSVSFQNKRCWIVGSKGEILYSDNNARSWKKVNLDSTDTFGYVKFFSHTLGVIVGAKNTYHTTNGGITWAGNPTPEPNAVLSSVQFINQRNGFIQKGYLLAYTSDMGQTWESRSSPGAGGEESYVVNFADSLFGFFAVYQFTPTIPGNPPPFDPGDQFLYRTFNGGASWEPIPNFPTETMIANIAFCSKNAGFVNTGIIMKTVDGGNTFTTQALSSFPNFIHCLNDSLGYAYAQGGRVFRTTNAGANWNFYKKILSPLDSSRYFGQYGYLNNEPTVGVSASGLIYADPNWYKPLTATGRIVKKENNDCNQDPNEIPLPEHIVFVEPGQYFGSTDASGRFAVDADSGNNTVKQIPISSIHALLENQYCPPANGSIPLFYSGITDTIGNNNFINEVVPCPILVLSQQQFNLRPCRKSTLFIMVQNKGTLASDSETVNLKLPPQIRLLSASLDYNLNPTDSTYRFRIKPLQPYESFTIGIVDSIVCGSGLVGHSLCITCTIPGIPPCMVQSPNWDGSDLEVASRCQSGQTKFIVHNKGAAMATTSQYQIFIDSAIVYEAPFQLAANGAMTVSIPASAPSGFVRLVVPQSANHPLSTFASAEANCTTGQSTNGMFPPPDESPLVDIECVTVQNSFDPNDKQVFPTGWGADGNVEPGTEFKYTVRFQNTGSDTAFKVVLVDTLDQDLDIASLQIGNTSHPYQFAVSGKGRPVLTWTFDNILLPDSNTNEEKSHGFVSYSVRPKAGLALGTRLENFADIYFDFNDPVRTNTTVNTLWTPTFTPGILDTVFVTAAKKPLAESDLSIYPNPTKGKLEVNVPEAGQMQLFNVQGEMVMESSVVKGSNPFQLITLPKGLYLIRFQIGEQQEVRKLVLE